MKTQDDDDDDDDGVGKSSSIINSPRARKTRVGRCCGDDKENVGRREEQRARMEGERENRRQNLARPRGGDGRRRRGRRQTESFLEKMNPFKKKTSSDASVQRQSSPKKKTKKRDLISSEQREQLFGNGLMGRVATGVINNLARKVGEKYEGMSRTSRGRRYRRRKCVNATANYERRWAEVK